MRFRGSTGRLVDQNAITRSLQEDTLADPKVVVRHSVKKECAIVLGCLHGSHHHDTYNDTYNDINGGTDNDIDTYIHGNIRTF